MVQKEVKKKIKKEYQYFCDDCGYRKSSFKTPDEMVKCPFCGKKSLKRDTLTADLLVREATID